MDRFTRKMRMALADAVHIIGRVKRVVYGPLLVIIKRKFLA